MPTEPSAPSRRVRWRGPVTVAWAVVIAVGLLTPSDRIALPGFTDKLVHALLFGLLSALARSVSEERGLRHPRLLAFLCAALYGGITEIGQLFVPGRSATVADAIADAVGAGLGLLPGLARSSTGSGPATVGDRERPG